MLRKNLKPLYLAGMIELCLLAAPVHAQDTTQRLVSQGNYWHDQGRDDLAADTWKKLLSIDPNQADALLGLGQIDLVQGRQADARRRLQQLEARHPNSPQAQRLRIALGGGQSGGNANLAAARRAAAAGRYVEAVRAYEASFEGKPPPPNLALEYYQSLAGTPQGWEKARDGLRRLRASEPDNASVSLALAQVLTYREPTRREGIAQLRELSGRSDVGGPARNGWRQALLWLGAGSADAPLYQAFLAETPNDAEVAAKLAQLRERRNAPGTDPNGVLLGEAFNALNAGNLAAAEQRFVQVLRARPRDPEALGGLGSVRLRQQRFSEAQELLRPAVAASGKWKSAYDSARYWQLLQQSAAASRRGAAGEAAALAQQAQQIDPKLPAAYVALGDLQSDAGIAEASYRKALALDADDAGALQGLVGLYSRQGRVQEATELFNRLPAAQREKSGGEAMLRSNVQRARARQALEAGDAVTAQTELENAMVERPGDPWVRLDLARLYRQIGRPDQARSVMEGLLAVHGDLPEAQVANALLAQESGDWATVYASLERIPQAQRTPETTQLRNVAWLELQARQAKALQAQGRAAEAQALLSRSETALGDQASQPQLLAALAGAWADAGNPQRALVLAQRLVAGGNAGTEERLQYAGVLLRAHQDAELSAILRQLQGQTMTPEQLRRYRALRTGYTLRQVDALRELGNLEAAYDALSPILAQQPQDRDALAALARLYASAGDQRQALAIYRQILQSHPNDLDTLVAAANSAAAQSDLDGAGLYLQRALAQAPDSPEVLAAAGRVYRSAGKNRKAEHYFRAALAAQQRQAGQVDNGLPGARGVAGHPSAARSLNPFAGMSGPLRSSRAVLSDDASITGYAAAPGPAYVPTQAAPVAGAADAIDDSGLPAPVGSTPAVLPVPGQGVASSPRFAGASRAPVALDRSEDAAAPVPAAAIAGDDSVLGELRALQSENSVTLAVGASYRSRDGEAGLGRMDDVEMPVRAEFPLGEGKLGLEFTPTQVDAGSVGYDYLRASRFGAAPAQLVSDLSSDVTRQLAQDDSGVGVSADYRIGGFSAEIGSTPIGFQEQNVLGEVGYRSQSDGGLSWSAELARRPVTDSVLSFAGTEDERNGRKWGGVTRNGGSGSIALDNGLLGGYLNLAAYQLVGTHVADNESQQADLGFYVHAVEKRGQSLVAGINLTMLSYDRNLSGFTYGHGGYFSPQQYANLGFPVHWNGRTEKVSWQLDASVGVQHFHKDASAYYPTSAALQAEAYTAAADALALELVSDYVEPVYKAETKTGASYSLSGAAEWQLAPQLFLGGRLGMNNASDYNELNANVYLRFVLDRLGAALGRAPRVLASPYASGY